MKKTLWNKEWTVVPGVPNAFAALYGQAAPLPKIALPHDGMISEERCPETASGNQTGYYPVKSYTYEKNFYADMSWREERHILCFDGVMAQAMVYVNGELAAKNRYGYNRFFADIDPFVRPGEDNKIQVIARNFENVSRWYPGSGIYRDVWLLTGGKIHIEPKGVELTTEDVEDGRAVISALISLRNDGERPVKSTLRVTVTSPDGRETSCENTVSLLAHESIQAHMRLFVEGAALWSPEEPNLYQYAAVLTSDNARLDLAEGTFGIRTLKLDARHGLRVNGVETKLRGACIHHDHGVIGAVSLPDAEEFKLRGLKAAGFNAIRSAHHPAGPALLDWCDRLGILVMDELTDMWETPKNSEDYSMDFVDEWSEAMESMVAKDWNHPSVVLYSLGNEIPEIGRQSGGRRNRQMANTLRTLDPTRFVTGAISGLLAVSDRFAEVMAQAAQAQNLPVPEAGDSVGSEALNAAMASMRQNWLDGFSVSDFLSEAMEEVACELDAVGYNYLTARHELEHTRHPDRVVVGSETYPTEIARLWGIVTRNHHVIGDFTWTGWDYLGEAGIGCYHYAPDRYDQGWYPDRLAYCGDIDINGHRRPVSYLREIAYGMRREPYICVERPERYGQRDNTNDWKYVDATASWTFPGFEGRPAIVHVLSPSQEVELFLNGVSLGRKAAGQDAGFDVPFSTEYAPGELTAVGYTDGFEDGRFTLKTAGSPRMMRITPSKTTLTADGRGVSFITVELLDENGLPSPWEARDVTVTVTGAATLAGFGSADPQVEGSYQQNTWKTFDDRVMVAVRSGVEPGEAEVTVSAPGCGEQKLTLHVE